MLKLFFLTVFFLTAADIPFCAAKDSPAFLSFSLGMYNTLDRPKMLDARVEYRAATPVFLKKLKPWAGLEVTSKMSMWFGGGFFADFSLGKNFVLTPSFGAGYYAKGKSSHDLHFPLEFRSQLELSYVFKNESRLGFAVSHISNASLGRHNPGTEIVSLYYHLPFEKAFQAF